MSKIFGYELKRALSGGLFPIMLVLNVLFAWYVLSTEIIVGIANTAPFSVWSYCTYWGKTLPMSAITILLIQAGYYGKKQKKVEILTSATPVTHVQMLMLRTAVLLVCFAVICIVISGVAAIFYIKFFGYYHFEEFIIPSIIMIIPCIVFVIGIGHIAGRIHRILIYILLLILIAAGFCNTANAFDIFSTGFLSEYPLTLPLNYYGEPDFEINFLWLTGRFIYLITGIFAFLFNIKWRSKATRANYIVNGKPLVVS
ncbi:MAG: hypothetical protein ACI4EF_07640 [Coprococcus sp.]